MTDSEGAEAFPYIPARDDGEVLYIAIDYVKQYTNFSYEGFTAPNRLQIYTQWDERQVAEIKKNTAVRVLGGVKSEVLKDVVKGDKVTVLEQMETWSKVKTGDAIIGYVENKRLTNQRAELPIPVTDYDGKLIGIITVDDIIDVIDEESAEDYSGLAGVDTDEETNSPLKAAVNRLPWLIVLLLLGMSTTTLISHYERMIGEASVLAIFISSITGTAGNAGTQSLAVAVRRLAEKEEDQPSWYKQFLTEFFTGLLTGFVTGLTICLIVGIWKQNFVLGFVIGMAMMCAITVANLAGSFIPNLMDRIGVDPAVACAKLCQFVDLGSYL